MKFAELFPSFIAGTPIKRKTWGGYWKYRYGRIEMHTKTGEIVDLQDTKDIIFTLAGTLVEDWEEATDDNVDIGVV